MRCLIVFLVLGLFEPFSASGICAQQSVPRKYLLKDTRIEIELHSGWGQGTSRIEVDGMGKAQLIYNVGTPAAKKYDIAVHPHHVLHMLQKLYDMRFFSYADDYSGPYPSVWLDGDTVRTGPTSVLDRGSIRVLCRIGSYSKCVRSDTDAPGDLWNYVAAMSKQLADSIRGR
jgi:hypothetical protein